MTDAPLMKKCVDEWVDKQVAHRLTHPLFHNFACSSVIHPFHTLDDNG